MSQPLSRYSVTLQLDENCVEAIDERDSGLAERLRELLTEQSEEWESLLDGYSRIEGGEREILEIDTPEFELGYEGTFNVCWLEHKHSTCSDMERHREHPFTPLDFVIDPLLHSMVILGVVITEPRNPAEEF